MVWLPAAKKPWCYFTEIANALDFPFLPENARRMQLRRGAAAFVLRIFAATHRDSQQQRDGERSRAAKHFGHREILDANAQAKGEASPVKSKRPGCPGLKLKSRIKFV